MIVKETINISDIKSVLCNADIYDTISGDNAHLIDEFEPPINDDYLYIGGYIKGEIIALMVYHKYLDGNECHVQVLPEHRKEHAIKFGEQVLLFKGVLPLYATIPSKYMNVLNFAKLNGFNIIKTIKGSYLKGGKYFDEYVLKYTCD